MKFTLKNINSLGLNQQKSQELNIEETQYKIQFNQWTSSKNSIDLFQWRNVLIIFIRLTFPKITIKKWAKLLL